MRKLHTLLFILLAAGIPAGAQTFSAGAFAARTSSPDVSEAPGSEAKFFPGATASTKFLLPKNFGLRVRGDFSKTPQIPTIFTTDEGEHKPNYEIRVNPEVTYGFGKFFVAAGIDAFYQDFDDDPGEEYSRSYGVNPTASFGVNVTDNHELSFTYLFKDNNTYLSGYRANYFYTKPVSKRLAFRAGFEANYYTFRETNRQGYIDPYYESDPVFKVSMEIQFKNLR